jgi:threonine dehydratase
MPVTLQSIREAADRIAGAVYRSPCAYSLSLSELCQAQVYCKLDHLQMTGSFKERGARNKLVQLTEAQKRRGIAAVSAGNHAQALAYHGKQLGIPVTVVMPRWAPLVKVTHCRRWGAEVILFGESFAEAREKAAEVCAGRNLMLISGFDDPDIIAGQGTLGLEIMEDVPDADAVIVPVGGGGLIAGVGVAVKAIHPATRIIGAEPVNAPTLHESLLRGEPVNVPTRPTLADGLAVAQCGTLCLELARQVVDEVVLVDEAEIARAILRLMELEKMVVEGGGAASLALAMRARPDLTGKKIVLCLSGGNVDITTISRVIEHGLAADGRLCRITAYVSDRPGSLADLTRILAATEASIQDVAHDRHFGPMDVALVGITCILETRGFDHIEQVKRALDAAGVQFVMQ